MMGERLRVEVGDGNYAIESYTSGSQTPAQLAQQLAAIFRRDKQREPTYAIVGNPSDYVPWPPDSTAAQHNRVPA